MKSFTLEWFNAQNGQNQPTPLKIIIELQFPENMLILLLILQKFYPVGFRRSCDDQRIHMTTGN